MKAFLLVMSVCLICLCVIAGCKKTQNEEDFSELKRIYVSELEGISGIPNNLSYINRKKVSALINVAGNGDAEEVKSLIKEGVYINGVGNVLRKYPILGEIQGTALVEAIANGHTEIVKILIEAGADVNTKVQFYRRDPNGGHADGRGGPYYPRLILDGELSVMEWFFSLYNTDISNERPYQLDEKQFNEIIELLKAAGAKE